MSKQKITSPFYGLFRGCLRFKIRDIKYIPSRLHYFFKHGFSQTAQWSFDSYFIEMMKQILVEFRDNSWGYPILMRTELMKKISETGAEFSIEC